MRVTATDTLLAGLLTPICVDFHRDHPAIELQVGVSHQLFDLSKREADVALRPMSGPHDTLVGRKLGEVAQAAYVSATHPAAAQGAPVLTDFDWVGPDAMLSKLLERWVGACNLDPCVIYLVDTLLGMRDAARAGLGMQTASPRSGTSSPLLQ